VDRLVLMLQATMAANGRVGLMLNAPRSKLEAILAILPRGKKPTIAELSDKDWVDINVVLEETLVREIVPDLKQAGAEDIVEYPLNKIIH
jgi:ATP phosphoribosyltransferase